MGNGFVLRLFEQDLAPIGEQRFAALPIRIGRSSLNDFQVSHKLVSEFHARIEEVDGKLCVRDLSSKNGVFVRAPGKEEPVAVAAQAALELEPYGLEFLLSPALRVQLSPAPAEEAGARRSKAHGSVLGNQRLLSFAAESAAPEDAFTASFVNLRPSTAPAPAAAPAPAPAAVLAGPAAAPPGVLAPASPAALRPAAAVPITPSVPIAPRAPSPLPPSAPAAALPRVPSAPTPVPVLPAVAVPPLLSLPALPKLPALSIRSVDESGTRETRGAGSPVPSRAVAVGVPVTLEATAWDAGALPAGLPGAARHEPAPSPPATAAPARDPLEVLALRGLRELAGSLVPGLPLETTGDLAALITKLHDSLEIFCRCFIPVREGYSRFVPSAELEQAARERSRYRSSAYLAVERAREPREVAAALLDWRNRAQDGAAAIENIFADLVLHQLALQQGALTGVQALLSELAPERIQGSLEAGGGRSALSLFSGRYRELWESYAHKHQQLEAAREAFFELFGPEFARAYQRYWRRASVGERTE